MTSIYVGNKQMTLHAMAISFATVPAGQWAFEKVDNSLAVVNEAVAWTAKNNVRSVSWFIFLPLLITVHYTRLIVGLYLSILFGKSLSTQELEELIDNGRAELQNIIQKGKDQRNAVLQKQASVDRKNNAVVDLFITVTEIWPIRPVANLTMKTLVFFGIMDDLPKKKEPAPAESSEPTGSVSGAAVEESETNENADRPESENHEHQHHEQHHNEQHHEQHYEHYG